MLQGVQRQRYPVSRLVGAIKNPYAVSVQKIAVFVQGGEVFYRYDKLVWWLAVWKAVATGAGVTQTRRF